MPPPPFPLPTKGGFPDMARPYSSIYGLLELERVSRRSLDLWDLAHGRRGPFPPTCWESSIISCKRVSARVPTRTNKHVVYVPTHPGTYEKGPSLAVCAPPCLIDIFIFAVPSCQCQVVRRQSHQNKPSRPWPQRRLISILFFYPAGCQRWVDFTPKIYFPGRKRKKKELGKIEAPSPLPLPSVIFPGWPVPRKKRKRNTEYSSQLPKLHFRDMHITTSPHPPARKTPLANNNRSSSSTLPPFSYFFLNPPKKILGVRRPRVHYLGSHRTSGAVRAGFNVQYVSIILPDLHHVLRTLG